MNSVWCSADLATPMQETTPGIVNTNLRALMLFCLMCVSLFHKTSSVMNLIDWEARVTRLFCEWALWVTVHSICHFNSQQPRKDMRDNYQGWKHEWRCGRYILWFSCRESSLGSSCNISNTGWLLCDTTALIVWRGSHDQTFYPWHPYWQGLGHLSA